MSPDVPDEPAELQPDPLHYRQVVSRFATGVAVVSARYGGVQFAMTANSFPSVSLDPVLVLFCVDRTARFHDVVLSADGWGVSVLGNGHEPASRWFATRGRPDDAQLADFPWTPGGRTGAALFHAAIATLECRTYAVHDGGDHAIVVGRVLEATSTPGPAVPLVFYESRYRVLPPS